MPVSLPKRLKRMKKKIYFENLLTIKTDRLIQKRYFDDPIV